jgi:hypothetical protein
MTTEEWRLQGAEPGLRAGPISPGRAGIVGTVLGLSLAVLAGCGDRDEPGGLTKQGVAFGDVPEPIRDAARKALSPGVKLDEAWKNLDGQGKLHSYELRGKNAADGKIREVRVSLTGEILESE